MSRPQRFTLVAAILGSGVAAVDGTIVNVALPAIQNDLGGGLQAQQWIGVASQRRFDRRWLESPQRRVEVAGWGYAASVRLQTRYFGGSYRAQA